MEIRTKDIEEVSEKENVVDQIKDISWKKVIAVAEENRDEYVVGADTVVEIDGIILGKPRTEEEAKNMLRSLSGRDHRVITAYSIVNLAKNIDITNAVESRVYFKSISEEEIKWYVESREPMDKAGAYGIQGLGSIFVDKIDGDFFAIMGFPINHFIKTLNNLGITIESLNKI